MAAEFYGPCACHIEAVTMTKKHEEVAIVGCSVTA